MSPLVVRFLQAASESAAFEVAHDLGVVEVRGADREKWLNGLVTCDVLKSQAGKVSYGLVVGRTGKMQADVRIVREPERLLLVVPASTRDELLGTFDRHLIMEDVELAPLAKKVVLGSGPQALERIAHVEAKASFDRTGQGGVLAIVDEAAIATRDQVVDGEEGEGALALRLRHGIAKWGVDFDATLYPHEASLEKVAVSFDKGCYLGQEVVCMVELRGQVKRKLALLDLDAPTQEGARVYSQEGVDIGDIRSHAVTPDGNRAIALVKVAFAEPNRVLEVGLEGAPRTPARVLTLCGRV